MKSLPRYTKVRTLGSSRTEKAMVGEVVIQEKIDGSQFRFGLNEDGDLVLGSKSINWEYKAWDKMFALGAEYITSIEERIKQNYSPDTYFFCEYLSKPKHNTLAYERVPKNNLVLFDIMQNGEWKGENRLSLEAGSLLLDIDVVPELWRGKVRVKRIGAGEKFDRTKGWEHLDFLKNMINTTMSILGGVQIEGVVIKNYHEFLEIGGTEFPLFTKYVRESFKEQHDENWKAQAPKATLQDYMCGFATEARWEKAIQHLRDDGLLNVSPKDIGPLMQEVMRDIKEECAEDIKDFLYKMFIKDLTRMSVRGLPEWYKDKLVTDNLK